MTNKCVWCEKPGTGYDPLEVETFDTGESIETVHYHPACNSFWGNCIFCKGVASAERPLLSSANYLDRNKKALRFMYHADCGDNRARTQAPWMFVSSPAYDGRSYAVANPKAITDLINLIGEGIRIQQRSWMRLPEPVKELA